jgi:integrase/recombinase XerD
MGALRDKMIEYMTIRGYATKTIKLYTSCINVFAHHFNKSPMLISRDEICAFFLHLRNTNRSDSTIHIYYEAIKYFYAMHNLLDLVPKIRLRRRPQKLPLILSQNEIAALFDGCTKLRLKVILYLLYSSGLRLSEAMNLTKTDIDFDRNVILVRNPKNGKDRCTLLSEKTKQLLLDYYKLYKPDTLLFESSQHQGKPLSASCVQRSLRILVRNTGIQKNVHAHTLRHCFATHLLENGTNIFYVMRLLGHSHLQTTMIYLHAQVDDFANIVSPLDELFNQRRKANWEVDFFLRSA